MKRKKSESANFLDMIPARVGKYDWNTEESGTVTIYVENTGMFNRAAQKLLKKPEVSQVHLEKMGSFIWPLIDGKKTVYAIGQLVKEEFGEEAEPLYPRLTKYLQMLIHCGFVEMAANSADGKG